MALGGGCEILLHCDALQASSETYMGLVESGVGLIPAWGGCVRYLERCRTQPDHQGPIPPVRNAFQTILMLSASAFDAQKKRWLRAGDGITMNPDRLLHDAKARALAMSEHYESPKPVVFKLPGEAGKCALNLAVDDFYVKGDATWHDVVVADALSQVLTGGETHVTQALGESDIAQLEREHFLSLLKTAQTQKRIAQTLKSGKPLREESLKEKKSIDEIRAMRTHRPLAKKPLSNQPLAGVEACA
jgi:3-hydroxyacyl-CoA dehydrogenase